jgi:hypothetical protein
LSFALSDIAHKKMIWLMRPLSHFNPSPLAPPCAMVMSCRVGMFLEIGGNNGVHASNTLFVEKCLGVIDPQTTVKVMSMQC